MISALASSGCGAKGIMELAMAKAVQDSFYPLDFLLGTSMGAITVAFYAAGQLDVALDFMMHVEDSDVYHTAPFKSLGHEASLLDNEPLKKNMKRLLNTDKVRACTIPVIVNATNMRSWTIQANDLRKLNKDDMIDAIIASAAVPILFPCRDGLVDGGTIDCYPVFDAISEHADRIIFLQCSNVDPKPINNIIDMGSQLLELTLYNQFLMTTRALALFKPNVDLVTIQAPPTGIGLLNFSSLGTKAERSALIESSYNLAKGIISKLQAGQRCTMAPR